MSYSDQTSGENLSRGHYQTAPRDFKQLNLPLRPQAKRKEKMLRRLLKRAIIGFVGEKYTHSKQRNKR